MEELYDLRQKAFDKQREYDIKIREIIQKEEEKNYRHMIGKYFWVFDDDSYTGDDLYIKILGIFEGKYRLLCVSNYLIEMKQMIPTKVSTYREINKKKFDEIFDHTIGLFRNL